MQKLVQVRGLRKWVNPSAWSIRAKIVGIVLGVLLASISVLTAFNYYTLSEYEVHAAGEQLESFSRAAVHQAGATVHSSIQGLRALALSPALVDAVIRANGTHTGRAPQEAEAEISVLDQAWKDGDPSVETLVQNIAATTVSAQLQDFKAAFPEEVEVFATDLQGLVVAMTDRTGDYLQADEGWWEQAYNDGLGMVFIDDVEYDESTDVWAINVGVPISDPVTGSVVGVLRGTIDISEVFGFIAESSFGETGHVTLIDNHARCCTITFPNG